MTRPARAIPLGVSIPAGDLTPDLRAEVEAACADVLPEDKQRAVLFLLEADETGGAAHQVYVQRVKGGWQLAIDAEERWGGPVKGRVMARLSKSW